MLEKLLPANEGVVDRALRVILGIALILMAFIGPATPWGFLGIIPLATGLLGSCPIYTMLGIRTCPMKKGNSGA